jgi:hypothetical protein
VWSRRAAIVLTLLASLFSSGAQADTVLVFDSASPPAIVSRVRAIDLSRLGADLAEHGLDMPPRLEVVLLANDDERGRDVPSWVVGLALEPAQIVIFHERVLAYPYDSLESVSRRTPSQLFCDNLIDQFDELLQESARRPLVMPIVLHSFVLGQPHRLRQFRRVVDHILRHRDRIWLTRPGEICQYIESLPAGIVPGSKTA